MQAYTEGIDERYVTLPVVLGHESSGVVRALGPGVTHLQPGSGVIRALDLGVTYLQPGSGVVRALGSGVTHLQPGSGVGVMHLHSNEYPR